MLIKREKYDKIYSTYLHLYEIQKLGGVLC